MFLRLSFFLFWFSVNVFTHVKVADINRDHKVQRRKRNVSNQTNLKEEEKAILSLISTHPMFMLVVILVVVQKYILLRPAEIYRKFVKMMSEV